MDAETIREKLTLKAYDAKVEYPKNTKKFKEDHIFDEDRSVRWNRQEVTIRNAQIDDQLKAYRAASAQATNDFQEDVILYLMENYSINNNREIAEKIYGKAWQDGHSSGYYEVLNEAIDIADFVADILKINKDMQ